MDAVAVALVMGGMILGWLFTLTGVVVGGFFVYKTKFAGGQSLLTMRQPVGEAFFADDFWEGGEETSMAEMREGDGGTGGNDGATAIHNLFKKKFEEQLKGGYRGDRHTPAGGVEMPGVNIHKGNPTVSGEKSAESISTLEVTQVDAFNETGE